MYLVNSRGTQYGPYGLDEINRMLAAGMLAAGDFAWTEGMAEWQPLHTIAGIQLPPVDPYQSGPAHYAPQGVYGPPGGPQGNSGMAVGSMVVGILSLLLSFTILFGAVGGVTAVILGHLARSAINRSQGRTGGSGMALAGLICGYLAVAGSVVIFAGATVGYRSIMKKGRETKMEANIATIESYIQIYLTKNNGQPPSQAAGLRALVTKRILTDESLLTDPWGEAVEYKVPASRSGKKYDVWSKGPDGISGNEDDIGNWEPLY